MLDARFAAEVAAAGGHHLLLSGPKGSGKTTLAERIPGLLPDLTREEAIELTALHSLAGALEPGDAMITRPPYAAPHHDASKAALVGGGSGQVRPGEISRSHCGVLFMDEFPLFRTDVIDALREPLESGDITIARAEESVTLPARSLVVLAANPCPCGNFAVPTSTSRCTCAETQRRHYQSRVRGPITDRIDITRHLLPLTAAQADDLARPETTAAVRARVEAARRRQEERYAGEGWRLNGQAPGPGPARPVAAGQARPDDARPADVRRPDHPARCGAGAPAGLDARRPLRRRRSRGSPRSTSPSGSAPVSRWTWPPSSGRRAEVDDAHPRAARAARPRPDPRAR